LHKLNSAKIVPQTLLESSQRSQSIWLGRDTQEERKEGMKNGKRWGEDRVRRDAIRQR